MVASGEEPDPGSEGGRPWRVVVRRPFGTPPTWPTREDVDDDGEETAAAGEIREALSRAGGDRQKLGAEWVKLKQEQRGRAQADLPPWHPDRL